MKIKDKIAKLIDLKSIITLVMVVALVILLFYPSNSDNEIKTLFCTTFGMVITYYFTHKEKEA